MGRLLDGIRKYLQETPEEVLVRYDYLNEIGPDVLEYADVFRRCKVSLKYSEVQEQESSHTFEAGKILDKNPINPNSDYCKAA